MGAQHGLIPCSTKAQPDLNRIGVVPNTYYRNILRLEHKASKLRFKITGISYQLHCSELPKIVHCMTHQLTCYELKDKTINVMNIIKIPLKDYTNA
jgi:hypothetical protein